MRIDKLFELQGDFFARFPDGFEDEAIVKLRKKHNVDKLAVQAQEAFAAAVPQNESSLDSPALEEENELLEPLNKFLEEKLYPAFYQVAQRGNWLPR